MKFGVTEKKQLELEARMASCGLIESDIEESFVRSSGPGGQHANKTSTAVRLLHKPTGREVKCTKTRSQLQNRFYARRMLCDMLESLTAPDTSPRNLAAAKIRKQKLRRKRRSKSSSA